MSIERVRPNIPKVPDVKDPGMPRDPEKLPVEKPNTNPKLALWTIIAAVIPTIVKRVKLPDTLIGRIIQTIAGLIGVGGSAAVLTDTVVVTGDIVTDVIALIVATLSVYVIGRLPVPEENKEDLENVG